MKKPEEYNKSNITNYAEWGTNNVSDIRLIYNKILKTVVRPSTNLCIIVYNLALNALVLLCYDNYCQVAAI